MFSVLRDECSETPPQVARQIQLPVTAPAPTASTCDLNQHGVHDDKTKGKNARQARPRAYHGHVINVQGRVLSSRQPAPQSESHSTNRQTAPSQPTTPTSTASEQTSDEPQWKFDANAVKIMVKRNYNSKELTSRVALALKNQHKIATKHIHAVTPFQSNRSVIIQFSKNIDFNCSELFNKPLRLHAHLLQVQDQLQ